MLLIFMLLIVVVVCNLLFVFRLFGWLSVRPCQLSFGF